MSTPATAAPTLDNLTLSRNEGGFAFVDAPAPATYPSCPLVGQPCRTYVAASNGG